MKERLKLLVSIVVVFCMLSSVTALGAESIIPSNAFSSQVEFDKYWSNTDGSAVSATFADNVVTFGNFASAANGWGAACKPKANITFDSYVVEADIKIKGSNSDTEVGMVGFVVNMPSDFTSLNSPVLSESCQAVRIMLRNFSHANIHIVSFGNHTGTAGDFVPVASTAGSPDAYLTYADRAAAEAWIHIRIEVEAGRVVVTFDDDANKTLVYEDDAWTSLSGGVSFFSACDGYLSVKNLTIVDASAPGGTEIPTGTEDPGQTPNQPTGDASMIVFAVAAVACAGALVAFYEKRRCKV